MYQDNVSYLMGKHALKFGGEFARIEGAANDLYDTVRGRIDFRGGADLAKAGSTRTWRTSSPERSAGEDFAPNLLVGNALRTMTWNSIAGFVQDDWRLTPKLMLNLGLRYSYTSPFHEVNNLSATSILPWDWFSRVSHRVGDTLWKPDHQDFSPRAGFCLGCHRQGNDCRPRRGQHHLLVVRRDVLRATSRAAEFQGRQRCSRPYRRLTSW